MLQHSTYHDEVRPQPFVRPSTTPAGGVSARPIGARHARSDAALLYHIIINASLRHYTVAMFSVLRNAIKDAMPRALLNTMKDVTDPVIAQICYRRWKEAGRPVPAPSSVKREIIRGYARRLRPRRAGRNGHLLRRYRPRATQGLSPDLLD